MLQQLIKFEFQYQSRQLFFWVFSALSFLFGWSVGGGIYSGDNGIYNSVYNIALYTGLLSLTIVFAIMFQVISGVLRDQEYNFSSLLYSTPIKKRDYFISRFLGVFFFSLFIMTLGMVGLILGTTFSGVDPARLLDFNGLRYFQVWVMMVLPTVFIMSAAIFTVSTLSKNVLATYAIAVIIYVVYWICALFLNSPMLAQAVPADPDNLLIAALADPFALSAFFEQTQYWTTFEKNYQMISFSGAYRLNRLIWIVFSSGLLVLAYHFTRFRIKDVKRKRTLENEYVKTTSVSYKSVAINPIGSRFQWQTLRSFFILDRNYLLKSLPFWIVNTVWIIIVVSELYNRLNASGPYSEKAYPTTGYLIEIMKAPLPFMGLILIVFYSGELVWRSRKDGIFSIIDATPVSNLMLFVSKLMTLLFIPVILLIIGILITIGFQLGNGYYNLELSLYADLFYFEGLRLGLYIVMALFIQSLVSNKYLGMLITGVIALLFGTSLVSLIGVEHPLLQINRFPFWQYSDMTAYGDYAGRFHYFAFYWSAFALVLVFLSYKLWRRGTISNFKFRLLQLLNIQSKKEFAFLSVASILFLIAGTNLFYQTNVSQAYLTQREFLDRAEAYERKYKRFDHLPRLHQVDLKIEADLFPKEKSYRYKVNYVLQNKNDIPVKEILISEREQLKSIQIENAQLIEHDTILSTWLFLFNEAIQPAEKISLEYEIQKNKKPLDTGRMLVKNGSFLMHNAIDPALGYRSSKEIVDAEERKQRNLPERIEEEVHEHHLHTHEAAIGKIPYEAIVSTVADQVALTPGDLVRSWYEGDRRYFHYRFDEPIVPFISIISGQYEIRKDTFGAILLEQYYHPEHKQNIEGVAKYTGATLEYCSEIFGKYPYDHLRIAEAPGHWSFGGIAMPGLISMVEDRLYLLDVSDSIEFNLVAKRTIHEVAHQWWGHLLMAKNVEGGSIFVEGFAKYTEAVMLEKLFGKWSLIQVGQTANNRYFSGRSNSSEREPALYLSDGEDYLSYGKMYTVMLAMKNLIGEEKVNEVIKDLVEKHRDEIEPTVVSTELLDGFYTKTPKGYQSLIDDWFKKVITYDLSIEDTEIISRPDGRFEVMIDVKAERFQMQKDGSTKKININEPIPIGLFSGDPKTVLNDSEIIYLEAHQINAEKSKVKIIVDERPKVIVLDPYLTRTEKNRVNNRKNIE